MAAGAHARRAGGAVAGALRAFWFEEPVSARDIGALAECRRDNPTADRHREELYTKFEFREVFERRAADIINPDVCNVGGIEELPRSRRWPRPITWSSRRTTTTAPPSGSPRRCTCRRRSRNFLITEYFVNFESRAAEVAVNPFRSTAAI